MVPIRLMVADAQPLFSESLGSALDVFPEFSVIRTFPKSGHEVIDAARETLPEVVVLDYWMPEMQGPAVVRMLLDELPECKVIMLSWYHGGEQIHLSLDAGAVGFLSKAASLATVSDAIRKAHVGENPIFAEELRHYIDKLNIRGEHTLELSKRLSRLTTREVRVLTLLATGATRDEVAERLTVSPETIKMHIRNILKKTGAKNHGEAVAMAVRCGWIQF